MGDGGGAWHKGVCVRVAEEGDVGFADSLGGPVVGSEGHSPGLGEEQKQQNKEQQGSQKEVSWIRIRKGRSAAEEIRRRGISRGMYYSDRREKRRSEEEEEGGRKQK